MDGRRHAEHPDGVPGSDTPRRSLLGRLAWIAIGFAAVLVGAVGIVVPGLPTTVFFIAAAGAFARSSPRLEAWVLSLPRIGPAVANYRAGQGMPRRAKVVAIAMMTLAVAISVVLIDWWVVRGAVAFAWLVGLLVILRVPTTETVVEEDGG